ncbi:MAG: hypothetical protein IJT74_00270 [Bacteroidales bacterium]|nr:hypothetical protein [Bacteroidales bacterium]
MGGKIKIVLIGLVMFTSCGQHRIQDYILDYFSTEGNENKVLFIDFHDLLEVSFSEYFLIGDLQPPEEIARITGHPYHGAFLADWKYRLIFFKGDTVVYEETIDFNKSKICVNYIGKEVNPKLAIRLLKGTPTIETQPTMEFLLQKDSTLTVEYTSDCHD